MRFGFFSVWVLGKSNVSYDCGNGSLSEKYENFGNILSQTFVDLNFDKMDVSKLVHNIPSAYILNNFKFLILTTLIFDRITIYRLGRWCWCKVRFQGNTRI